MHSLWEILRSIAPAVAGLLAMLVAIVVLGLYVQRSIGRGLNMFPVSILEQEEPLRAALSVACRVGS